jgi:hypothetical protein
MASASAIHYPDLRLSCGVGPESRILRFDNRSSLCQGGEARIFCGLPPALVTERPPMG